MTPVLLEVDDSVGKLTLNRPDQGNALDMAMAEALLNASSRCAADPAVRCVLLTGAGRLFCAGGDVGTFAAAGDRAGPFLRELANMLHEAVRVLASMPKPLVTVVNGPAAGAGLSLAALGDVALAGRSAHFTAAYSAIGLTPDGGMTWLLPRLVGLRRAQEIILTNRRIPADEAAAIGLVTRAIDDEALQGEAEAAATRLAAAPTAALGASRALLGAGWTADLSTHLDREAESIAAAGAGPEGREGVAAFLSRRKPNFRG